MRRRIRAAALVLALVLALGTVAAAANIEYDKDKNSSAANKNGIQVAPLDSQNCKVEFKDNSSEALTVTYTDDRLEKDDMVIVLLLKSSEAVTDSDVAKNMTTTLTAGTIQYIDQADVTKDGEVTFRVFPQNYSNGVIRLIWADKTSGDVNTATVAAVKRTYTPGDVNDDSLINGIDVSDTLLYVVGKKATINQQAADVSGDGLINAIDVSDILLHVVKGKPFTMNSN